jgi:DNA-binding transcriptional regulator YdaS (Cro superfamily)
MPVFLAEYAGMNETPLQKLERVLGRYRIAELCDCSYSAVQQWTKNGVPAKHALTLEEAARAAGEEITAQELCPKVFRKPKPRRSTERAARP